MPHLNKPIPTPSQTKSFPAILVPPPFPVLAITSTTAPTTTNMPTTTPIISKTYTTFLTTIVTTHTKNTTATPGTITTIASRDNHHYNLYHLHLHHHLYHHHHHHRRKHHHACPLPFRLVDRHPRMPHSRLRSVGSVDPSSGVQGEGVQLHVLPSAANEAHRRKNRHRPE